MEVDSLELAVSVCGKEKGTKGDGWRACADLHQVVLEKLLQLPLGGRVSEVPNVKSPALGGAGDDGLVLSGRLVVSRSGLEGGVCQLGGDILNGSGHDGL